jgi:hypothetical protein
MELIPSTSASSWIAAWRTASGFCRRRLLQPGRQAVLLADVDGASLGFQVRRDVVVHPGVKQDILVLRPDQEAQKASRDELTLSRTVSEQPSGHIVVLTEKQYPQTLDRHPPLLVHHWSFLCETGGFPVSCAP